MTNDEPILLDLEAIKRRHLDARRMEGRTFYLGHIEIDLANVIDENEMLREMVNRLAAQVRELMKETP